MTNLAAERARFHAKRDAELLRQRARRVLAGRWNMAARESLPAVLDLYPELTDAEARALAKTVREVQRDEAPVHLPVETTPVRPLELEGKDVYGTPADADRWRRIFADSMANRPVVVREREVEG